MVLLFIIRTCLILSSGVSGFKILVLFPTPSLSHHRPIMALTERLVQEGHEVFVVSPNKVEGLEQNNNYTYVDVSFSYQYKSDVESDGNAAENPTIYSQRQLSKWDLVGPVMAPFANIPVKQFLSETFLKFKKRVESEKIKFDLAIVEAGQIPITCTMVRFLQGSIPIVSLTSLAVDYFENYHGSPMHYSFVPFIFNHYTDKMSLLQRLENWYSGLYLVYMRQKLPIDATRRFFKNAYGHDSGKLVDGCWRNISLSLVASNSLYYYPRLLSPNVIEVGPLHLKPPKQLPKNLQDWLDGAEKGVIYFSFGSNMKSKSLPKDVRDNFLKFFKELPLGYRVLWKWELEGRIPGQPHNVLTQKWMPQESILAHPKVRIFITQGGLQSFQEAVHFGVPTVGVPWFGDHECVVSKMVDAKIGVRLLPPELQSFEKVKAAIETVLNDESYLQNMKRYSAISRDFSSVALDRAVFWVEHVTRHGGAAHLRPATADVSLFQFLGLDIISVVFVAAAISIVTLYSICKALLSRLRNRSSKEKEQ